MLPEQVAKICHEMNRAFCLLIDDTSQDHWEEISQEQKNSCIAGVNAYIINPDISTKELHDNWMKLKLALGWKYGPIKDSTLKTHPCLMPRKDLPREQQFKDDLFLLICRTFLRIN
jgi:hypothetical protein